jgi:predicted peptidase
MRVWLCLITGFAIGLATVSHGWQSAAADEPSEQDGPPSAVKQHACELDRTAKVQMNYLLYLPKEYEQKESWPLLLFLHGAGERGDDLEQVKKHGPPKLIEAGEQFPFIVVSPQCPRGRWWETFDLATLLDEIEENYKVDKNRVYVTGLSMGGFGTWALAAYQPERFAAMVPICGGGDAVRARFAARVPAWVFHGAKDSVVPIERSETMVEALKKARGDGDVKFTVYPEAGHDSWTETYANPELYEWLLQQKRTDR